MRRLEIVSCVWSHGVNHQLKGQILVQPRSIQVHWALDQVPMTCFLPDLVLAATHSQVVLHCYLKCHKGIMGSAHHTGSSSSLILSPYHIALILSMSLTTACETPSANNPAVRCNCLLLKLSSSKPMTTVVTNPPRSKFSTADQTHKQTMSRPNLRDLGLLKGCCRDFSTTLL